VNEKPTVKEMQIKTIKKDPVLKSNNKTPLARQLTPVILATQGQRSRGSWFQARLGQIVHETPSRKYPTEKRAGGVAQVVQCWPSKHEALNSNPTYQSCIKM
jgi:hypothetical protein